MHEITITLARTADGKNTIAVEDRARIIDLIVEADPPRPGPIMERLLHTPYLHGSTGIILREQWEGGGLSVEFKAEPIVHHYERGLWHPAPVAAVCSLCPDNLDHVVKSW